MVLSLVLLSWLLWPVVKTQFNMYSTDEARDNSNLQTNCLHYYDRISDQFMEKAEYCLDSTDKNDSWNDDFLNTRDQNFTFDQLRQLNITTNQLLSWYATIDLAERYQYYLDHPNESHASEEIFYQCTETWFGSRCQYSFALSSMHTLQRIIQNTFRERSTSEPPSSITYMTCYVHLKCDRGGLRICLDWREICDGRIDCVDGGADEAQCADLEMNECDENEYRCHNGLCIPKEFLKDDTPQCLDKTDVLDISKLPSLGDFPYIFNHEEHSCRPGYEQFSCGDGQCVSDLDTCQSKRHLMLIESISVQGNLPFTCWAIMACLTKILNQVDGISCHRFLKPSDIHALLKTCEDLTQFPTVPVLFGHVRFLYYFNDTQNRDINFSFTPDYICYDQQLCDFLVPTFFNGNYSCRHSNEFGFNWNTNIINWPQLIRLVEPYFRKCLIRYNNNSKNDSHHPSLYCCKNSSKCISKHRILDNISDCYLNDDEEAFELSCLIRDVRRFKCSNPNKCYSSLFSRKICYNSHLRNLDEIEFQEICDRHVHMFPAIIDGQNHTDETECEHLWPCNNFYTRCDGFWSCPNGDDEENCTDIPQICPLRSFPCVSPDNYTFRCLSAKQIGDEHIECLGALDELQHCRSLTHLSTDYPPFRCKNDVRCLSRSSLCDTQVDCPLGDDEIFCKNHASGGICQQETDFNYTAEERAVCLASIVTIIPFSLTKSVIYPPSQTATVNRINRRSIERRNIANGITNGPDESAWAWRCNHGLYVHHWLGGNRFSYKCFCPPSHYGDICQYQNQRVSFTVGLKLWDSASVYAIIISLIDDDDDQQEIISYNHFTLAIWGQVIRTYNVYLTYAKRPKNNLKNYSVRVDIFNRVSVTYLASWHFTIPFSFLPVNRMAVILHVPRQPAPSSNNCPLTCYNGKCMKYMNKKKLFCRCDDGWSSIRCNISVRCGDCSSDSKCIGIIHNRSICVCPVHKGGSRCLLTPSCPEKFCKNNGTCLVLDDGMSDLSFGCHCPKKFTGKVCNVPRSEIEISLHNIEVSSFVLIYTFGQGSPANPKLFMGRVIPQKLTMFQRTISAYVINTFQIAIVGINRIYYIAVVQEHRIANISTAIGPNQRCVPINELLNSQLVALPKIRRIKHFHAICQNHLHLMCFIDEVYICLCTLEHYANCFKFDSTPPKCSNATYCLNEAECWQDHPEIPSLTMCVCTECFSGDRCQYYAKGIGLTLDDILRYEIRPNATLYDQTIVVKCISVLTVIMFVAGLINSVLSIMTFRTKKSREVGCGLYLLTSSITSLLTMSIFMMKFWFLILTQINTSISHSFLQGGCISFEFILKALLYTDNWLNVCVALERCITVSHGIRFNKALSKRNARWIVIILPLFIMMSIIHEPLYRRLFDDADEQRSWCVFHYSPSVYIYNTTISFFHFVGPFCANLFSTIFIIFTGARRRTIAQKRQTYKQHLCQQFKEHKNLIISPMILTILMLPRPVISLVSECVKRSHISWLYLSSYFISFIPSMSIFFVFVLPSDFYSEQFKKSIKCSQ